MKPLPLLLGLSLTANSLVVGQENSSYSDPVGYHSIDFQGGSDTGFSLPLFRDRVEQGLIQSVDAGTSTITVNFTMTADEYVYQVGSQTDTYFVLVCDGTKEGGFYTVTDNGTDTLTIDMAGDGTVSDLDGATIKVFPYWTLGTLFPNGEGVVKTTDPFSIQSVVFFTNQSATGVNLPFPLSYLYFDSSNDSQDGWYSSANFVPGAVVNDTILSPDTYFVVRNPAGANSSVTLTGEVLIDSLRTPVNKPSSTEAQDIYIGVPYPVAVSAPETDLLESGAFTATTDPFTIQDVVFVFDNGTIDVNKPFLESYLYFDSSDDAQDGWYSTSNFVPGASVDDQKIFSSATGLVVRKPAGSPQGTTFWIFNSPYTAQ
ncbi:MAG: TIGR02597 family protein [Verrucomicrobiota bacterium]